MVPVPALRKDARASEDVEEHGGHELALGDVAVAEAHASEGVEELDGRELAQDDVIALPVIQRLVSLRTRQAQMLKNPMVVNLLRTMSQYSRLPEAYVAEAQAREDVEELNGHELAHDVVTVLPVGQKLKSLRPSGPEQRRC